MKLDQLLEMPQYTPREFADILPDYELMTPFFITDERLASWYDVLAEKDNVVAAISKNHESASLGIRTTRHDGKKGVMLYGDLQFKSALRLGYSVTSLKLNAAKVLQVSMVSVVKTDQFKGLGSFLYSSLVQAGFTIISDTDHFPGGKELWKKLGRSHLQNEAVYILDKGELMTNASEKPIEYDGVNIHDDQLWSLDEMKRYVLFMYTLKKI